jgi:hypothetical protein
VAEAGEALLGVRMSEEEKLLAVVAGASGMAMLFDYVRKRIQRNRDQLKSQGVNADQLLLNFRNLWIFATVISGVAFLLFLAAHFS